MCAEKFRKIHRKTAVLEFLLNKVDGLKPFFIKMKLQHKCFVVNFETFLKTPIQSKICKRLLLD